MKSLPGSYSSDVSLCGVSTGEEDISAGVLFFERELNDRGRVGVVVEKYEKKAAMRPVWIYIDLEAGG